MTDSTVHTENRQLQGPHGDIPIRVYTPSISRPEPVGLVWCHGGSYIYGDLDMAESDWVATSLAEAGISMVTVDYRLAPAPQWALNLGAEPGAGNSYYPVAINEIEAVLAWANTELHLQSPAGWALGGASAGGTLTAGLTLRLRDHGLAMPSSLLLAYPLLHPQLPQISSELAAKLAATTPAPGIPLTSEGVQGLTLNYVNGDLEQLGDPYAFPGGHDLSCLPPTFILNSDVDTIRASGDAFAAELASAGVDMLTVREHGSEHGHLNEPTTPGAQRSILRMIEWLTSPLAYGRSDDSSQAKKHQCSDPPVSPAEQKSPVPAHSRFSAEEGGHMSHNANRPASNEDGLKQPNDPTGHPQPSLSVQVTREDDIHSRDQKISDAVERLLPAAFKHRHGILVTQQDIDMFTVQVHPDVPCGIIHEKRP